MHPNSGVTCHWWCMLVAIFFFLKKMEMKEKQLLRIQCNRLLCACFMARLFIWRKSGIKQRKKFTHRKKNNTKNIKKRITWILDDITLLLHSNNSFQACIRLTVLCSLKNSHYKHQWQFNKHDNAHDLKKKYGQRKKNIIERRNKREKAHTIQVNSNLFALLPTRTQKSTINCRQ